MTDKSINYISRENPYKITNIENIYKVSFYDGNNHYNEVEVSKEIADIFKESELKEISYKHKVRKHQDFRNFDDSEFMEELLYSKCKDNYYSLENDCILQMDNNLLYSALNFLNNVQKRRITKYFFYNKSTKEIAIEEDCSTRAIRKSIDLGLLNLKNILKNS